MAKATTRNPKPTILILKQQKQYLERNFNMGVALFALSCTIYSLIVYFQSK